jgi:uncharacterized protein
MNLIDPGLAEILVCTVCHGELEQNEKNSTLVCSDCGRTYPVEDGIPNMLVGEGGDE